MNQIKSILRSYFSIHGDTASQDELYSRLVTGAQFRGTNLCVLILAILIASIGLNMNSTAVIIGAMLISPLMGSIMAIAYGFASGDLKVVEKYLLGFFVQVLISLATSVVYFTITPISNSTSELLARTSPTIWDVLIAIFGGLAGIIGMTRKEKSNNIIPGVAIATALMPPLCTAGFGIATRHWSYFFGAFYLFLLNSYFICFSSVIVLLLLNVSRHTAVSGAARKKAVRKALISTVLIIIPSILISVNMVNQANITGFREENMMKLQTVGTETQVLFPQVKDISVGDTIEYNDDGVSEQRKIIIWLNGRMNETDKRRLTEWMKMKYEDIDEVDIIAS